MSFHRTTSFSLSIGVRLLLLMSRNRQPPLPQLPHNNLPPPHLLLLINRCPSPLPQHHIRQLHKLVLERQSLCKLRRLRFRNQVSQQRARGTDVLQGGVGDAPAGELGYAFEYLWGVSFFR